ncbi:MAG: hypothetical protein ACRD44_03800, partial [Bryobacteraceae bacterium]
MHKTTLVTLATVGTVGMLLFSQDRFDYKVRDDFFAGFLGNTEALDRAMKTTEKVLAANPKHAEAMVWHGSGVYFQASHAFQQGDRQKGIELATKGMQMMDE